MADDIPEIPDDAAHRSTRELYEEFKAAGIRQQQARRQRRIRVPTAARRVAPVVIAVLLASSFAAVATRDHTGDGGTLHADPTPSRETPAGRELALAVAPDPIDPASHGFPWGLRLRHVGTQTCAVAGRLAPDGRIGLVQSGQFIAYGEDVNGSICADVDEHHALVVVRGYGSPSGIERTLLFGSVDRTVTSLHLERPAGRRDVPIANDGSFIVAYPGPQALHDATLVVTSGTATARRPLGPDAS